MGIETTSAEGKGRIFLSINGQEGRFYEGVKNEQLGKWESIPLPNGNDPDKKDRTSMTGTLLELNVVNDLNKNKDQMVTKLQLLFADTDPEGKNIQVEAVLWRSDENDPNGEKNPVGNPSRFGIGVLGGLYAADFSKPMTLTPWFMPKDATMPDGTKREREGAGVSFRQNGEKLRPVFLENGKEVQTLSPLPSQQFGGKIHYDKTGWNNCVEEMLVVLQERLHPGEAEDMLDHEDDAIDPDQAAQAAGESAPRPRA